MTLSERQRLFAKLIGEWLVWIYQQPGLEITFGEAQRSQEQAIANAKSGAGIAHSLHLVRLALDVNLYVNGVYQKDTEAYRAIGEKWKTLHADCRWGGDFKSRPDGNHVSLTYNGVA